MSTSTASASASNSLPSDSRSRPLRRLSQLRSYTQTHFSPSSSGSQRSSYRNSISQRVPWRSSSSQHVSTGSESAATTAPNGSQPSVTPSSCPEPERQSTLSRYGSAFIQGYRGYDHELQSQGSSSSRSTPTNESNAGQPQGAMSRLRGFTHSGESSGAGAGAGDAAAAAAAAPSETTTTTTTNGTNIALNTNIPNTSSTSTDINSNLTTADEAAVRPASATGDSLQQTSGVGAVDPAAQEATADDSQPRQKPTIRFFPYQDPLQSSRPSLHFIPLSRTLPSDSCVIRVGRYSERDGVPVANPTDPSDAPVGFKSKVVSRKHCELIFMNGQWHIKDVGSSSGTFLNHMRLSQPNMTSKLYTVKDGDIVQLGIDFRGGEEMIFRCVRIRIECNRAWQRRPNEFNKNTESLIRNLGKGNTADFNGCRECSICLGSVLRPYQCLFMAACAHVWHYKCVSRLIHTPDYPIFQCPNCRAYTDLNAEVDDSNDMADEEPQENHNHASEGAAEAAAPSAEQPRSQTQSPSRGASREPFERGDTPEQSDNELPVEAGLAVNIENMRLHGEETPGAQTPTPTSTSAVNPDNVPRSASVNVPGSQGVSPSAAATGQARPAQEDNPLTPRNDTGPLAFDGWTGLP